jgi:ribosome-associated protein
MDIRKLQRVIVDGLEDVKAQNIVVFNTEHLSALFERVIIASGTSNRQTKALAQGVRDSVRKRGMQVLRTEGEDNGEWIIVDCGAAVVHLMQPSIRDYYHLEEIWGDKPVKMKLDTAPVRLVKASEPEPAPRAAGSRSPARKPAAKKAPARPAATKRPAAKPGAARSGGPVAAPAAKPVAKRAAAKVSATRSAAPRRAGVTSSAGVTRTVGVKRAAAKPPAKAPARSPAKSAAKAPVAKQAAAKSAVSRKPAAKKAPARKSSGRA